MTLQSWEPVPWNQENMVELLILSLMFMALKVLKSQVGQNL